MNKENIEIELFARKSWLTIAFWIVFFIAFSYLLLSNFTTIRLFNPLKIDNLIFFALGLIIIIFSKTQILWMLTGKIKFKLEKESLTVEKYFIGIKTTKIYNLALISNARVSRNKNSNTYWGGNGFRIYDRNSEILSFVYKGNKIVIGDKLENFDADILLKEINARKK